MLIKICGVTTAEDARAAADLGADAVGLNFWAGSPRRVDVARAAEIARALRGAVTLVGLFVDASHEEIERVRAEVPLDVLQLHGRETPEACLRWGPDGYWKAVRSLAEIGAYSCTTYLLDAAVPGAPGGTGVPVDPALAAAAVRRARVILAGGLGPENVGPMVRALRPFGVDVASGVERSPGVKDVARVEAFVRAARRAETS
jgi:phosphoribosylanthranilate isomerase